MSRVHVTFGKLPRYSVELLAQLKCWFSSVVVELHRTGAVRVSYSVDLAHAKDKASVSNILAYEV